MKLFVSSACEAWCKVMTRKLMIVLSFFSINLLVVYHESMNLIGYITCRLSADSLQF